MEEIWKEIKGYEELYQVSNLGRVKSLDRVISNRNYKGKLLKSSKTKGGYLQVSLWKENKLKRCYIHRLVAEAFLPNPLNLPCVNHKDENKTNNHVENLEWCSYEYNNRYGTRTEKITKTMNKPVLQLRMDGSLVRVWPSVREVERQLHFNKTSISRCCNKKPHCHSSYHFKWCYANNKQ